MITRESLENDLVRFKTGLAHYRQEHDKIQQALETNKLNIVSQQSIVAYIELRLKQLDEADKIPISDPDPVGHMEEVVLEALAEPMEAPATNSNIAKQRRRKQS